MDPDRPDYVVCLKKAIYCLKQAPRAWYIEIKNFLLQIGFVNSLADASLFVYCRGSVLIYMLVYVNDIILTGNNNEAIASVISTLAGWFSLKDEGDIHYFLGIEVTRTNKGLHLMQRKYILDLLTKTNMLGAKPVSNQGKKHLNSRCILALFWRMHRSTEWLLAVFSISRLHGRISPLRLIDYHSSCINQLQTIGIP